MFAIAVTGLLPISRRILAFQPPGVLFVAAGQTRQHLVETIPHRDSHGRIGNKRITGA